MPPTDPRFLAMTQEDIEAEYLAIQYFERGSVPDEVVDENFDDNIENLEELFGVEDAPIQSEGVTVTLGKDDEFEEVINDQRH